MNDNEGFGESWILSDAHVVAVTFHGVPFSEAGLTLKIREGRTEVHYPEEEGECRSILAYEFQFWVEGGQEPISSEQTEATVVLSGILNGRPCKVWGEGFVGRDNFGRLEGSFWRPPRIEYITADEDFLALSPEDEAAGHGPR